MTSPTCFANEHSIAIGYGPCDGDLAECDNCGRSYCDEHGQHGGDREGVARPDVCERCLIESDLGFSSKVSPDRQALYDATTTYLLCGVCSEEYAGDQSPSFDVGTGICGPCEGLLRGEWQHSADDAACAADFARKERLEEGDR